MTKAKSLLLSEREGGRQAGRQANTKNTRSFDIWKEKEKKTLLLRVSRTSNISWDILARLYGVTKESVNGNVQLMFPNYSASAVAVGSRGILEIFSPVNFSRIFCTPTVILSGLWAPPLSIRNFVRFLLKIHTVFVSSGRGNLFFVFFFLMNRHQCCAFRESPSLISE